MDVLCMTYGQMNPSHDEAEWYWTNRDL